jgi:tartrate dehydratase alpha subunit/fumarate hydratase class I-like protein
MASNDYDLGNYFDESKVTDYTVTEETKDELFLDFTDFKQPKKSNGIETVANLINNLLFLKKGTYPDCPDMGIEIQKYQFELLNDKTIDKITEDVQSQIDTYIESNLIRDLLVKKISNENIRNALGIGFEVQMNNSDTTQTFFIIVTEEEDTRKLISQMIFS